MVTVVRASARHIGDAIGREISLSVIAAGQARQELAAGTSPAAADAVMGAWQAGNGGPAPTTGSAMTGTRLAG